MLEMISTAACIQFFTCFHTLACFHYILLPTIIHDSDKKEKETLRNPNGLMDWRGDAEKDVRLSDLNGDATQLPGPHMTPLCPNDPFQPLWKDSISLN